MELRLTRTRVVQEALTLVAVVVLQTAQTIAVALEVLE
jgi:hypothetical protein